jgi:hypothetical protein
VHDWKEIVRGRLSPLPLEPGRQEEVIEELSHQLEDAYKEALAGGASEPEALRRSLAQFNDWENLRKDVFRAVKAEELPVWQQRGILSPKRPWVWATLVLSLALLALSGFRQSLATLSAPFKADPWEESFFSKRTLGQMERQAIAQSDARALAFVALHHPDIKEAALAAEKAIALDAQLTWISSRFSRAYPLEHNPAPWIARLKAWDPDNAFPYLLEAGAFFDKASSETGWMSRSPLEQRRAMAAESDFLSPMQKAFAAPKYDNYAAQRFELDRAVFQQQGWDRPDLLMFAEASRTFPNLLATRTYAEYLVEDVGGAAERAGRNEEAVAQYQLVGQFGVRLQRAPNDLIERLIGIAIRLIAYKHLSPLLRHQGHIEEAALVESQVADLHDSAGLERKYRLNEDTANRAAPLVLISGVLVLVFAAATLAWLGSVVLLRWKENGSSLLNYFASVASAAPLLLLLASLSLYSAYYPYVRDIGQFESESQLYRDLGPFWANLAGVWSTYNRGSWLNMMLWPTVWCIVVAVMGTIILRWVASRRQSLG